MADTKLLWTEDRNVQRPAQEGSTELAQIGKRLARQALPHQSHNRQKIVSTLTVLLNGLKELAHYQSASNRWG